MSETIKTVGDLMNLLSNFEEDQRVFTTDKETSDLSTVLSVEEDSDGDVMLFTVISE